MITSLINRVSAIRYNVDEFHDSCFENILSITKRLNIPISKARTNRMQIYRDNRPSNSVSDYYRMTLTIPHLTLWNKN